MAEGEVRMKTLVAVAADCQKGFFANLVSQVHAAGIDFMWKELVPFSWRKLILWELEVARMCPDTLIAFADAWDMLFLGTKNEFDEVLSAQPLLLHSEKVCWPDTRKKYVYPPSDSPWRYVNGTGPAGLGRHIADAIEFGMDRFPIIGEGTGVHDITVDNDQRFWTDIYLSGIGKLDTECRLSQSLVDLNTSDISVKSGRVRNNITGSSPLFIHANGAAAMQGYRHLMDILAGPAKFPCSTWTNAMSDGLRGEQ